MNISKAETAISEIVDSTKERSNSVCAIFEHDLPMRQPESTPEKKPPGRWRLRNPDIHKKEKKKRRRNAGRPYEKSNGNFVPPRTIGIGCTCRKKCRSLLSGKELQLFHEFWDLGSYDAQQVYLSSRILVGNVKRHYKSRAKDSTKPPNRNVSYQYFVNVFGRQIFVCKMEFLAVHGLQFSAKRVELLSRQLKANVSIPKKDGRGKHKHHKRIDADSLNMVRQHINIIPKYVSHYSRVVNPNKVYLDCDMTISELYRKYVKWISQKNEVEADAVDVNNVERSKASEKYEVVSEDKYRRIFCTEFNIGFKLPRSDTAKTCDSINIQLTAEKDDAVIAQLKAELETHHNEAQKMQDDLKEFIKQAKATGEYDVFIFDLQQALLTPTLTVGEAFYLRKALTYNFGIHDGKTGKGFMFMWSEIVAGRGSDEIASCIWKYIKIQKPTAKRLVVYSDNCGGQNKNWNLMALWRQLVLDGVYESIEHRFLIPGHTRLPCDRDFALIENEKKRVVQVYSPEHWYKIVRDANKKNPFVVTPMNNDDFFTFERLLRTITKKTTTDAKVPLQFRLGRCFLFKSENGGTMYVRHDVDKDFTSVKIDNNAKSNTYTDINDLVLKKYDGCIGLKQAKIADLRKLMPYIPSIHRSFYEIIFLTKGVECDTADDAELV